VDQGTAVSLQPVPKAAYRSDFRKRKISARSTIQTSRAAGKRATARPLPSGDKLCATN